MTHLLKILARRNWGLVRYNAIFQNLSAVAYIALAHRLFSTRFLLLAGFFLVFSTCMTAYAYLANDFADVDLDRRHGKDNAFLGIPRPRAALITTVFLLAGTALSLPFWSNAWFAPLLAVWLLLSSAYSLPPLRLKETGAPGLVATVLSQQTLPLILLFVALAPRFEWGAGLFVLHATLRGLSSDLGHQVRDYPHDARTRTATFAVRHGLEPSRRLYAISLELERLSIGVILAWLVWKIPTLDVFGWLLPFSPLWPLVVLYAVLLWQTAGRSWRAYWAGTLAKNDPYDEARQHGQRDALHWVHHSLPSVLVPLWLSAVAAVYYYPNLLLSLFILVIFQLYRPSLWRKLLPARHGLP